MKRILFVCHTNPFSVTFGAEQRTSVFLTAFLENGCLVDIAYIGRDSIRENPQIKTINIVFNGVLSYAPSVLTKVRFKLGLKPLVTCKNVSSLISELLLKNKYDFIACRYIEVAELAGLWKYRSRVLLDIDDLPFQSSRFSSDKSSFFQKKHNQIVKIRLRQLTKRWIESAKCCFLPNKKDAEEYKTVYFPNIPLVHVDSFVNCGQSVLFIGKLDWKPNVDGLLHFLDRIWKGIIECSPNTILYIGGKGLSDEYRESLSRHTNVIPLGFVPDLYDFYSKGNIVIVPVYSGGGTNIKVIEAMSMAKACVVSPFATRGFEHIVQDGRNILVANNDSEFVSKLVSLIESESTAAEIAQNAVASINAEYSQYYVNSLINEQING